MLMGCGGSGPTSWEVHADGRIGPLQIDVSTEYLRWDRDRIVVLAIWNGRVDSIGYLGPHTVYYDGLR
jgi:hypothetical protein